MLWESFNNNPHYENKILLKHKNIIFLEMISMQEYFYETCNKYGHSWCLIQ